MNPQIKQEWLDELPKHTQTHGILRDSADGKCCLGVLCHVAEQHGVGTWAGSGFGPKVMKQWKANNSSAIGLPYPVQEWCGLRTSYGSLSEVYLDRLGRVVSLSDLNDAGCTFDQIADVIKYFF